jgi:cytochrome c553
MKKTIISTLLVGITLVAGDAASVYKSGVLLPVNGEAIYKKQCATCHGDNGEKIAFEGSVAITGMDKIKLAKELKDYRYGSINKYGYGALMKSVLADLSWDEIDGVSAYVNGLK